LSRSGNGNSDQAPLFAIGGEGISGHFWLTHRTVSRGAPMTASSLPLLIFAMVPSLVAKTGGA